MSDRLRSNIEQEINKIGDNGFTSIPCHEYDIVQLLKIQSELLLDIRDLLSNLTQNQGVDKWGSKL